MSTVPRPPLRLLVSIQSRAMPAPTRAMTWQWMVEVGIPRKVQPITQRGGYHHNEAQGGGHGGDLGAHGHDHSLAEHEETHSDTQPTPGHEEQVVLARVKCQRLLVNEVDGDQGPDAVTNIIAAMIQSSEKGSNDLKRSEDIFNLLVLMKLCFLPINLGLGDIVATVHFVHHD